MDEEKRSSGENPEPRPPESEPSRQPDTSGSDAGDGTPGLDSRTQTPVRQEGTESKEESPLAGDPTLKERNPLHVSLAVYDGPLDLLLDLIRKNEMNIYDIPIAEITKKYLEYLAEMKKFDLDIAGDFLVMAATLVYIKSRMLLPQEKDEEEDESGGDPRAELVRKLLEYQAFKEAAKELGIMEDEQGKVFTRQVTDYYLADLDAEDVEIDNFSANLYDLLSAFQVVLAKAGRKDMHEIYEEQVSIEERVRDIQIMLTQKKTILFSELFPETWTRNYLIATFLALLEIVRTKYAKVRQKEKYGEITLEKR